MIPQTTWADIMAAYEESRNAQDTMKGCDYMKMCEQCYYYRAKRGSVRKTCCKAEIEADMKNHGVEWLFPPMENCFGVWVDQNAKMATRENENDFTEEENAYLIRLANTPNWLIFDDADEEIII